MTNPNGFVNIFYSSGNSISDSQWLYDDNAGIMYFIARDGDNSGLFTAIKAGGFKDKTFRRSYIGQGFEMNLFDSFNFRYNSDGSNSYYWNTEVQTDEKLDAQKAVAYILEKAYYTSEYDYSEPDEYGYRSSGYKAFKLASDMVDIRFDLFKNETGVLRALYLLSKVKMNEEALEALDCYAGLATLDWLSSDMERMILLGKMFSSTDGYRYRYQEFMNFISKTCYIAGSETKATTWNDDSGRIISYDVWEYNSVVNLTANEQGVFGICTNVLNSWSDTTDPYFYIVQLADSQGKITDLQNSAGGEPAWKTASSILPLTNITLSPSQERWLRSTHSSRA